MNPYARQHIWGTGNPRKPEEKQKSIVKTDTNSAHAPPPAEGDLPPGRQETSGKPECKDEESGLGIRIRDKEKGEG